MYRIELAPGEETALRTLDELATGIRNGIISSRARIWHNAGRKWLPIEFHPHYQAALKQLEAAQPPLPGEAHTSIAGALTGAAPAAPTMAAAMPPSSLMPPPASKPVAPTPEAASAAGTGSAVPTGTADRHRSALRPIGLLAGGIVMIVGAQMVASATSPDSAADGTPAIAAPATPAPVPVPVPVSVPMQAVVTPVTTVTSVISAVPSGSVVRGPVARGPEAPLPLAEPAVNEPGRAEEMGDTMPAIMPAPVIDDLSLPAAPIDNP